MNRTALAFIILSPIRVALIQCSAAAPSVPIFNQAAFNANAKLYGNKTANLIELKKVAGWLNHTANTELNFDVPPFFGLSSPEIIDYLKTMPYNNDNTWAYILEQWNSFEFAPAGKHHPFDQ